MYTKVCSLGTLCHTARIMERIYVKNESYPFDWVFSDENIVLHAISDDFKTFLDKSLYSCCADGFSDRCCGHQYYHENFFFHKNPRQKDDYEYYERCVARFKKLLSSDERKLFIMMFSPEITMHPKYLYKMLDKQEDNASIINNIKSRCIKFNNGFSKYTDNYKLLIIINLKTPLDKDGGGRRLNIERNDTIDFLTIYTENPSSGVQFADNWNADNLLLDREILIKYPIKTSHQE